MTRRAWIWWLALAVPVATAYPLLRYGTWPASVVFDGPASPCRA